MTDSAPDDRTADSGEPLLLLPISVRVTEPIADITEVMGEWIEHDTGRKATPAEEPVPGRMVLWETPEGMTSVLAVFSDEAFFGTIELLLDAWVAWEVANGRSEAVRDFFQDRINAIDG